MKIVVLDKENFLADFPQMSFECSWGEYARTEPDEIIERLAGADIAVTHKIVLNESHFKQLPNLKMITTNSTGYNTIEINAAKQQGITVCNVQDWCTNSVIEHVLSFIFTLRRNIISYHNDVKRGEWKKQANGSYAVMYPPGSEIAGSTIGIFGHGTLGKHLEQKATALGMKVLIAERKLAGFIRDGYSEFEKVIALSDVIVLLSPLNEQTYKMIGPEELKMMKESAILINCGRGGLVDETALAMALENGIIAGAAIDVMEQEPPEDHHPLLNYTGSNLLLSSHVAFASRESIANNTGQIVANIEGFHAGIPQNVVN
jgi:glycerate dehydrogenase